MALTRTGFWKLTSSCFLNSTNLTSLTIIDVSLVHDGRVFDVLLGLESVVVGLSFSPPTRGPRRRVRHLGRNSFEAT